MNAKKLRDRLLALADRISDDMNGGGVGHRLQLFEPALVQMEEVMYGIETKLDAIEADAEAKAAPTPRDPKLPKLKRKKGKEEAPKGEIKIATARAGISTVGK